MGRGPNLMDGVLTRGKVATHRYTKEEGHVTREAETGVTVAQVKEPQGWPAATTFSL